VGAGVRRARRLSGVIRAKGAALKRAVASANGKKKNGKGDGGEE
jgi:hypothetical protein